MADFINPSPWLDYLVECFAEAAAGDGMRLDPALCGDFAEGIGEVADVLRALITLADAQGAISRIAIGSPPTRQPAERRRLAALAAPLDPEGRVLAFPDVAWGGSAA